MPHNNRMSTSHALKTSNIWSQTIGHDPYAAENEQQSSEAVSASAQQSRDLLELARHQNIANAGEGAGTRGGDDFASKMFHGLKRKKKRSSVDDGVVQNAHDTLLDYGSSSEEEYVEQEIVESNSDNEKKKRKKAKKSKDRKRRGRSRSPSRKHRKSKKDGKKKKRSRSLSSSSSLTEDSGEDRKRRKKVGKGRKHH